MAPVASGAVAAKSNDSPLATPTSIELFGTALMWAADNDPVLIRTWLETMEGGQIPAGVPLIMVDSKGLPIPVSNRGGKEPTIAWIAGPENQVMLSLNRGGGKETYLLAPWTDKPKRAKNGQPVLDRLVGMPQVVQTLNGIARALTCSPCGPVAPPGCLKSEYGLLIPSTTLNMLEEQLKPLVVRRGPPGQIAFDFELKGRSYTLVSVHSGFKEEHSENGSSRVHPCPITDPEIDGEMKYTRLFWPEDSAEAHGEFQLNSDSLWTPMLTSLAGL